MPRRADLRGADVVTIHAGRWIKADLLRLDTGGGPVVVKDFGGKRALARWLGRLQIAIESRAYRRLEGIEGIPRFFGCIDPHALVIEYVDGRPLASVVPAPGEGAVRFERLSSIVGAMHERGVVHWDLRAHRNVLLRPDGGLCVVDFASAMALRPDGWMHRLLFRRLRSPDRSALLKWKQILGAGEWTEEEERFVRRHRRWRRLWIFNRKGARR